MFALVKRKAGVSPARTRRCNEGALFPEVLMDIRTCERHWRKLGR